MNRDEIPAAALDECDSCQVEIIWTTTEANMRSMPVEVEPVVGGTLALSVGANGAVWARVVKPELAWGRKDLHHSHFVNCPDAPKWRQRHATG